jgi:vacuolar-type H+-ATPase subunit H
MTNHETLVSLFDTYLKENEKFTDKGVKAAGTRARKALAEFTKAAKERRKEIQDSKTTETKE